MLHSWYHNHHAIIPTKTARAFRGCAAGPANSLVCDVSGMIMVCGAGGPGVPDYRRGRLIPTCFCHRDDVIPPSLSGRRPS
ncbi:hypothetical protein BD779DRAFT_1525278 [Infundibulicybe gibba]|nr:hypothetical protein BD779DRAFT_1525278 [Infundibulicybe gibba]